jgi:hypothetical protein
MVTKGNGPLPAVTQRQTATAAPSTPNGPDRRSTGHIPTRRPDHSAPHPRSSDSPPAPGSTDTPPTRQAATPPPDRPPHARRNTPRTASATDPRGRRRPASPTPVAPPRRKPDSAYTREARSPAQCHPPHRSPRHRRPSLTEQLAKAGRSPSLVRVNGADASAHAGQLGGGATRRLGVSLAPARPR